MSDENKKTDQNIPPEVMAELPPEVKAQLGVEEKKEQQTLFAPGTDTSNITDSLNRLREGFEKIGLTLIGRMGEFTTTLERVSMSVQRIDKVESVASEVSYQLKKLEKKLDEFNMNFSKISKFTDSVTLTLNEIKKELAELKTKAPVQVVQQPISQVQPITTQSTVQPAPQPIQQPAQPVQPTQPTATPKPQPASQPVSQPTIQQELTPQTQAQPATPQIPVDKPKEEISIPAIEGGPIQQPTTPEIEIPKIEGAPITPQAKQEITVPSIEGAPIKSEAEPGIFQADASPEVLVGMIFDSLTEQLQPNMPYFKIADILDGARDSLQKTLGWKPVIYAIGKEARNLRRKEGGLDQNTINDLVQKINDWKNKLLTQ
ncbi:MAG: hypothetical protein ACTSRP_03695 [Candidatus Helarchaeota archaeon]